MIPICNFEVRNAVLLIVGVLVSHANGASIRAGSCTMRIRYWVLRQRLVSLSFAHRIRTKTMETWDRTDLTRLQPLITTKLQLRKWPPLPRLPRRLLHDAQRRKGAGTSRSRAPHLQNASAGPPTSRPSTSWTAQRPRFRYRNRGMGYRFRWYTPGQSRCGHWPIADPTE